MAPIAALLCSRCIIARVSCLGFERAAPQEKVELHCYTLRFSDGAASSGSRVSILGGLG